MSARATAWALSAPVTSTIKTVLTAYANVADDEDCSVLTRERLIVLTDLSETTVRKAVVDLVEAGRFIDMGEVVRRDPVSGHNKLVSRYRLAIEPTVAGA
jgi:hypothetical protein